jgi:hypothetical protein
VYVREYLANYHCTYDVFRGHGVAGAMKPIEDWAAEGKTVLDIIAGADWKKIKDTQEYATTIVRTPDAPGLYTSDPEEDYPPLPYAPSAASVAPAPASTPLPVFVVPAPLPGEAPTGAGHRRTVSALVPRPERDQEAAERRRVRFEAIANEIVAEAVNAPLGGVETAPRRSERATKGRRK